MKNILFLSLFLIVWGVSSPVVASESPPGTLFFKHWVHYDSQGIPCSDCHTLKGRVYTLPGHKVCEFCHPPGKVNDYDKSAQSTCFKCHPKDKTESTTLLSTLKRAESRIFFHSDSLRDSCNICHGPMLDDEVVMGALLTSKDEKDRIRRKAHRFYYNGKCENCHLDHNTDSQPNNHQLPGWKGAGHSKVAPEFNCRICHTKSFCQSCHEESY